MTDVTVLLQNVVVCTCLYTLEKYKHKWMNLQEQTIMVLIIACGMMLKINEYAIEF